MSIAVVLLVSFGLFEVLDRCSLVVRSETGSSPASDASPVPIDSDPDHIDLLHSRFLFPGYLKSNTCCIQCSECFQPVAIETAHGNVDFRKVWHSHFELSSRRSVCQQATAFPTGHFKPAAV